MKGFNVCLGGDKRLASLNCERFQTGASTKILNSFAKRSSSQSFEPEHQQFVFVTSLDLLISEYQLPSPAYVKIDVDGAEYEILRGARKMLNSVSQLFIEVSEKDENYEDILYFLDEQNFILKQKYPVKKPDSGYYEGLYNIIYSKT